MEMTHMFVSRGSILAMLAAVIISGTVEAGEPCDGPATPAFESAQRLIASLHPDKPGQLRVVANDLSEFTVAETQWLRSRIHAVSRAWRAGDERLATLQLAEVTTLIEARRRQP
jgi:hypothetical protein